MTESEGGAVKADETVKDVGITEGEEGMTKDAGTAEDANEVEKTTETAEVMDEITRDAAEKIEEKKEDKKICQCLFSMIT